MVIRRIEQKNGYRLLVDNVVVGTLRGSVPDGLIGLTETAAKKERTLIARAVETGALRAIALRTFDMSLELRRLAEPKKTSRVAEVNRELKRRGEQPRLRAGRGYYYFDGDALSWRASSVYVYRADEFDLARWMAEYDLLKKNARF